MIDSDRKLLRRALEAGHAFEAEFNHEREEAFRLSLLECRRADSVLVRRLAELAPKVSIQHGPKHLMALLVPIERLSGRSVRDEEFLFAEKDGQHVPHPATQTSRIVVCENIRSAFNVGSIFRTHETFGGREIWLSGYSPDPQKTAMGTDQWISTRRFDRTEEAINEARKEGYSIIALENAPGSQALKSFVWPKKSLLILGNERFGVDSQTLAACDHVVRIETSGNKNSLNVGTAFGIAAASWNANTIETSTTLQPIGFVRGGFANPQVAPRQGSYSSTSTATIELESRFEGRPSNFAQALKDLEGFERVWILFGFDRSEGWLPQVRPPRGDGEKKGLFATRAPHRPNRLGLSSVRLRKVQTGEMPQIEISEHDFLDGTPVFDIKPYIPAADAFPEAKAGWVDAIASSANRIHESDQAREKLDWLEANGEARLRNFISEQLRFQPFDSMRKRVEMRGLNEATIAFRTWRIDFEMLENAQNRMPNNEPNQEPASNEFSSTLTIVDIRSGYEPAEMAESADPYEDKSCHRAFQKKFF